MNAGMFWNSGFSSFASITNIVTLSTTWNEDKQLIKHKRDMTFELKYILICVDHGLA